MAWIYQMMRFVCLWLGDLDGHTRVTRIPYKRERVNKLSDVWMKGYIGGLPDNF